MFRRLPDVDTGDQGQRVRFVGLIMIFGLVPGVVLGGKLLPSVPTALLVPGVLLALALLGRTLWPVIDHASRGLIMGLGATSGDPYAFQYSEIEALVVRGAYEEAAGRYREIAATAMTDAEPHLRLGDLLAMQLGDLDGALAAYRGARGARPTRAEEARITNALIDLHRRRGDRVGLKDELSRYARLHPDSPAGRRAREDLRRIVAEEQDGIGG